MAKDPSDMTPQEFADWWHRKGDRTVSLDARLAARDERILRDCVDRALDWWTNWNGHGTTEEVIVSLRDAILNKPRFVPGQLVRSRDTGVMHAFSGRYAMSDLEPVRVTIDAEGRVIVEE